MCVCHNSSPWLQKAPHWGLLIERFRVDAAEMLGLPLEATSKWTVDDIKKNLGGAASDLYRGLMYVWIARLCMYLSMYV